MGCTVGCAGSCTTACSQACSTNCVGLCHQTCSGACQNDCSGKCTGSCQSCSYGCNSGCTSCSGCSGCGGCDGSCSGSCSGGCSGGCSSCSGGCSGCGGCDGSCSGCSGGCQGGCGGCDDGCSGGCKGSCQSSCDDTCNAGCTQTCKSFCNAGCSGMEADKTLSDITSDIYISSEQTTLLRFALLHEIKRFSKTGGKSAGATASNTDKLISYDTTGAAVGDELNNNYNVLLQVSKRILDPDKTKSLIKASEAQVIVEAIRSSLLTTIKVSGKDAGSVGKPKTTKTVNGTVINEDGYDPF